MGSPIISCVANRIIQQTDFNNPAERQVSAWHPKIDSLEDYNSLEIRIAFVMSLGNAVSPAIVRFRVGGTVPQEHDQTDVDGTVIYTQDVTSAGSVDGFPKFFELGTPAIIANPGPGRLSLKLTMQMEGDNVIEHITALIRGVDV
jgi:hypothetical protein